MSDTATRRAETERWFVRHGLPYFVDDIRARVHAGVERRRLLLVTLPALAVGALVGVAVGVWRGSVWPGVTAGSQATVLAGLLYAATVLEVGTIARWALRRTARSVRSLFPLVTRALPLLLLFVTFLFINAEVWQVAATLKGVVMWLTVLLFLGITVSFLLVRLPEELAGFDEQRAPAQVVEGCVGTPMEAFARDTFTDDPASAHEPVTGLQKANLVLMLLIAQLVQVLLLSASLFVFFLVFGMLIMDPDTIRSWTGAELTALPHLERANWELVRVSLFLAAFSGLYFTVYAVTDETYRTQFFTQVLGELRRAVSVRTAYRRLQDTSHESG